MKVAVVGGTGFIGQHVVRELASIPRISLVVAQRRESLSEVGIKHVLYQRIDLASETDPFAALGQPDILVYLAWGHLSDFYSIKHFEYELPLHYLFLKRTILGGLSSLLVVGTCYEYGLSSGELKECLCTQPVTSYGFAKDVLRKQLDFLSSECQFYLTWARLFYVYGDGQPLRSLVAQLEAAALRGDHKFGITRGDQIRDFLSVSQIAKYIVDLSLNCKGSGIVNVCSGEPVSVRSFVEGYIKSQGWSIAIETGVRPYPKHEPLAFWGSTEKLFSLVTNAADSYLLK